MAKKTFPYAVIWNGEIVPANTPIEVEEPVSVEVEEAEKEAPKKKAARKNADK